VAEVTRRHFLKTASIGAAAAGVLGTGGAATFSALGASATSLPAATPLAESTPGAAGSDIFAYVADASTGAVVICHGGTTVTVTDMTLCNALSRAAQ
jgi:hypothetical protein